MAIKIVLEPVSDENTSIVVRSMPNPNEVQVSVGEYGVDTVVRIDQLLALLEGLQSLATMTKMKIM